MFGSDKAADRREAKRQSPRPSVNAAENATEERCFPPSNPHPNKRADEGLHARPRHVSPLSDNVHRGDTSGLAFKLKRKKKKEKKKGRKKLL